VLLRRDLETSLNNAECLKLKLDGEYAAYNTHVRYVPKPVDPVQIQTLKRIVEVFTELNESQRQSGGITDVDKIDDEIKVGVKALEDIAVLENQLRSILFRNNNRTLYRCPKCSTDLYVDGKSNTLRAADMADITQLHDEHDELMLRKTTLSKRIESLNTQRGLLSKLGNLTTAIAADGVADTPCTLDGWKRILTNLVNDNETYHQNEAFARKTEKELRELDNRISRTKGKLETLTSYSHDEMMSMQTSLHKGEMMMKEYNNSRIRLSEKTNCLRAMEMKIAELCVRYGMTDDEEIRRKMKDTNYDDEMETIRRDIELQKQLRNEHLSNMRVLQKYMLYDEYQKRLKLHDACQIQFDKSNDRLAQLQLFKRCVAKAESESMTNVVNHVNCLVDGFMSGFFDESRAMFSRINTFKTLKSKKNDVRPEINIEVVNDGNETDVSSLSGGEFDRVVLAYMLATAYMFDSPILILDECVGGLDQNLSNMVFAHIKAQFSGKTIVVISPRTDVGVFDDVIELDR
jgi:chromosome segregation ATPase